MLSLSSHISFYCRVAKEREQKSGETKKTPSSKKLLMPIEEASKASSSSSVCSASDKLLLAQLARSAGLDLRPKAVSALVDALAAGAPPPSLATVLGALCRKSGRVAVSATTTST